MTLLLGPPSSGKTSLLLALAGKLDPDLKVGGRITYNGHGMDEFVPQRTSAYISQHDLYIGEMTVRETLAVSARCQGVGTGYGIPLMEVDDVMMDEFYGASIAPANMQLSSLLRTIAPYSIPARFKASQNCLLTSELQENQVFVTKQFKEEMSEWKTEQLCLENKQFDEPGSSSNSEESHSFALKSLGIHRPVTTSPSHRRTTGHIRQAKGGGNPQEVNMVDWFKGMITNGRGKEVVDPLNEVQPSS